MGVLKPRTVEKSVDKCDLSIVYGEPGGIGQNGRHEENGEEIDSLETKLIVRLHCKHGNVESYLTAHLS